MRVLQIFETITSIPHCSGETAQLRDYILRFAKRNGYRTENDEAGNILCYRKKRDIALQAHYDMVCVGSAPCIELLYEGEYLRAKNSSLGADNGIGVAMMLTLMESGYEAEYLFTNDEEIGLVGAKALDLSLKARQMINLDSEEFGAIYVGCAGGVDLHGELDLEYQECDGSFWRVWIEGPGGHSGVDIHKQIPNAIKELAHFLRAQKLRIASIRGGERVNSIPAHAEAIVCGEVTEASGVHIEPAKEAPVIVRDRKILDLLLAIPHGVRGWNEELGITQLSQNLALVRTGARLELSVSLRSMTELGLERLEVENRALFEGFGIETFSQDRYPPWEPRLGEFSRKVWHHYERYHPEPTYKAIHAGLEAAVLAKRYPDMQIVSIGPDIESPHSVHERVRLATIEPIYRLLQDLLCAGSS